MGALWGRLQRPSPRNLAIMLLLTVLFCYTVAIVVQNLSVIEQQHDGCLASGQRIVAQLGIDWTNYTRDGRPPDIYRDMAKIAATHVDTTLAGPLPPSLRQVTRSTGYTCPSDNFSLASL